MRKTHVAQRKRLVYPRRTKSTSTSCERPVVLGVKRSLESALTTPPVEELSGSPRKNGWIKSLQKRESNYEFTASRSHYTNKQEMKLRSIACALVNGANSLSNPMCQLVYGYQLHKFVDEEEDTGFGAINISCIRCGNLKPGEREACFNIVEQNWRLGLNTPPPSKQKKWHDLFDCYNSWYILCRHKGFLVGFVHFRFVVACLKAVLDCRDIHLCQVCLADFVMCFKRFMKIFV